MLDKIGSLISKLRGNRKLLLVAGALLLIFVLAFSLRLLMTSQNKLVPQVDSVFPIDQTEEIPLLTNFLVNASTDLGTKTTEHISLEPAVPYETSIDGDILTITLLSEMEPASWYTLKIDKLISSSGQEGAGTETTFRTYDLPSVIASTPQAVATDVSPVDSIDITLDKPLSSTGFTYTISPVIALTVERDGNTKYSFYPPAGTGFAADTTYTFTMAPNLELGTAQRLKTSFALTFTTRALTADEAIDIEIIEEESQATDEFFNDLEDFYAENPYYRIISHELPYETVDFKVTYLQYLDQLLIYIYTQPIEESKQKALDWLASQGLSDLSGVTINWATYPAENIDLSTP